jgi:hypothetical protein
MTAVTRCLLPAYIAGKRLILPLPHVFQPAVRRPEAVVTALGTGPLQPNFNYNPACGYVKPSVAGSQVDTPGIRADLRHIKLCWEYNVWSVYILCLSWLTAPIEGRDAISRYIPQITVKPYKKTCAYYSTFRTFAREILRPMKIFYSRSAGLSVILQKKAKRPGITPFLEQQPCLWYD